MYERQSRLSDQKRERLIEHFVARTTIREAAEIVDVHRNTAASFYARLRNLIAEETEKEMETLLPVGGEIELYAVDFCELYQYRFRNRWDAGYEVFVFSLLKRGGNVYTEVIPEIRPATLMSIIERLIQPDSVVYTDGDPEWDALDDSDYHHVRPKIQEPRHWNQDNLMGIAEFWTRVHYSVAQFRGIPKQNFHLFLKEFEWRFNNGEQQGREALTSQLKAWVRLRH